MKIVQIDGVKGMVTAVFAGICTIAGFAGFPGYVIMSLWNKYLVPSFMFPKLSLFQGILLWGIVVLVYIIVNKDGLSLSFRNTPGITDDEIESILRSARVNSQMKMMNHVMAQSDKFVKNTDDKAGSETSQGNDTFITTPMQSSSRCKEDDTSDKMPHIK